ncbi:hypothetical protein QJQ45_008636 [Haematococcus lacustris]|nr:hypothetical protein QJQ45_008636 [Haematococcus lacustris]
MQQVNPMLLGQMHAQLQLLLRARAQAQAQALAQAPQTMSPDTTRIVAPEASPQPSRVKNKPKPAPTGQATPTPTHKQARLVYNTSSSANSSSAITSSAGNSSGDDGSNDDGSASSEGWVGSKLAAGVAGCKKSAVGVVGKAKAAAGVAGRTRSASGVAGQTGAAARVAGRTKSATGVFALAKATAWVTARARKFEYSEEDAEICRHYKQPQEHHDFIGESVARRPVRQLSLQCLFAATEERVGYAMLNRTQNTSGQITMQDESKAQWHREQSRSQDAWHCGSTVRHQQPGLAVAAVVVYAAQPCRWVPGGFTAKRTAERQQAIPDSDQGSGELHAVRVHIAAVHASAGPRTPPGKQRKERREELKTQRRQVVKVPGGAVLRGCKKNKRKLGAEVANSPAPRSSQAATLPVASESGPSTPPPTQRSKRTKAEPAAEPTKGKGKAQGKAAKAKPAPQPGRWLDRDCNAALNMQRIGESKWRPLELCYWPEQGKLPAKGKEYPGLGASGFILHLPHTRNLPPADQLPVPAIQHTQYSWQHRLQGSADICIFTQKKPPQTFVEVQQGSV